MIQTHHITPKCMIKHKPKSFVDDPCNLVDLEYKHHVAAHKWLFMLTGDINLRNAWISMKTGRFVCTGHTKESRVKMSNSHMGKSLSEGHKNSISKSLKGKAKKPFTDDHKMNISLSQMGSKNNNYGNVTSKEIRTKIGINQIGIKNHKSKIWFIHGKIFYCLREAKCFFDVSTTTIKRWVDKYKIPHCYSINKGDVL